MTISAIAKMCFLLLSSMIDSALEAMRVVMAASSSNAERRSAQELLDRIKSDDSSVNLAVSVLGRPITSDAVQCALAQWALQIIREVVRSRWSALNMSEKEGVKAGLLAVYTASTGSLSSESGALIGVVNKIADLIGEVALRDWPANWENLFPRLIAECSPRWILEIASRLCELATEGGGLVLSPVRQKAIVAGVSEKLLSGLLTLSVNFVQSNRNNQQAVISACQVFTSLAELLRRSDFLIKFQADSFFISSLSLSGISDETRFALLNGLAVLATRLDSKRASIANLPVPTELTEQEISRFSDGVSRLACEVLGPSGHASYCNSGETVRDLHRCLAGVVSEVSIGCAGLLRSSLLQTSMIMSVHPSLEVQACGLSIIEFYAKKHRNDLLNHQASIVQICLVALHRWIGDSSIDGVNFYNSLLPPGVSDLKKRIQQAAEIDSEESGVDASQSWGKVKTLAVSTLKQLRPDLSWAVGIIGPWLGGVVGALPNSAVSYGALLVLIEALVTVELGGSGHANVAGIISAVLQATPPLKAEGGVSQENSLRSFLSFASAVANRLTPEDCRLVLGLIFSPTTWAEGSQLVHWYRPAQNALLTICKNSGSSMTSLLPVLRGQLLSPELGARPWAVEALMHAFTGSGEKSDIGEILQYVRSGLDKAISDKIPGDAHRGVSLLMATLTSDNSQVAFECLNRYFPALWSLVGTGNFSITQPEWDFMFGTDEGKRTVFTGKDSVTDRQWFHLFSSVCNLVGKCASLVSADSVLLTNTTRLLLAGNLRSSLLEIVIKHALVPITRANAAVVVGEGLGRLSMEISAKWHNQKIHNDAFEGVSLSRGSSAYLTIISSSLSVEDVEEISAAGVMECHENSQQSARKAKRSKNRFSSLREEEANRNTKPSQILLPVTNDASLRAQLVSGLMTALSWQDGGSIIKALGLLPSVLLRCWRGASAQGISSAEQFCLAMVSSVCVPLGVFGRELPKSALGTGRLQDFCAERVVSSTVTQPSDFVEKLSLVLQSELAIGLSLFEAQARVNSVAPIIENVAVSAQLTELIRALLVQVGDDHQSRALISSVFQHHAGKAAKPAIRSLVLRIVSPGVTSDIIPESIGDASHKTEVDRSDQEASAAATVSALFG